jgi:hypothetical protein
MLIRTLAALTASIAVAGHATDLTDKEWGETRCDLVSQENRAPCLAAHARLNIPSDSTVHAATPAVAASEPALTSAEPPSGDAPDEPEIARAKKIVADRMKDPPSAMFKDVVYVKEKQAVCGSVNAKNSYGGYAGYGSFAVGPGGEVHIFNGSTTCYGSDKMACYKRKIADVQAIKENCSSTPPEPKLPDDPKELRARVDALDEVDGAMSWALQEDVMTWLERNQAATDADVAKAMVDLCGLMSDRGSKAFAARIETIERNAASKEVRSECANAREEVEDRN